MVKEPYAERPADALSHCRLRHAPELNDCDDSVACAERAGSTREDQGEKRQACSEFSWKDVHSTV